VRFSTVITSSISLGIYADFHDSKGFSAMFM
jgi:hypothetical protein